MSDEVPTQLDLALITYPEALCCCKIKDFDR